MAKTQFLLWIPMIALAFINAAIREVVIVKHASVFRAHQLSTMTLIILCSIYIFFIFPFLRIQNGRQALLVGAVWVGLTILFEIGVGLVTKKSWDEMLMQYNLAAGYIWPVFLVWLFFFPYLVFTWKNS